MSQIFTKFKVATGLWDFAIEGGAASTINMRVYLPKFSRVFGFYATERQNITGGGAIIAFGYTQMGSTTPASNPVSFMGATTIGTFVLNVPLRGVNLLASPLQFDFPIFVTMLISVSTITAGKMQFDLFYTEQNQ